jgi:ribosomal protein L7Ae-like RNA K-turn-binding protein
MDSKFMRLLGLCMAAGKVVSGEQAVSIALNKGRAALVVLDAQSAPATQQRAAAMCSRRGVNLLIVDADIGRMVGHEGRKLAAVTDAGFAKALLSAHDGQMQ